MRTDTSTHEFKQRFGLTKGHKLTMVRSHVETRNGAVFEVQWLEEHDEDNALIARYRSWTQQAQRPPYRKQIGWERFTAKGQLLDREVRYSKRDTNDWLH